MCVLSPTRDSPLVRSHGPPVKGEAVDAESDGVMSVNSASRALTTSEPLQPQDLVITLLGTYIRPRGGTVWSGGLVQLLGEFGFTQGAARAALTRLVRRGLLSRVRQGRLIHYRVTERADRLLAEGDRRIYSFGQPRTDGNQWTILWHRIPEDRRLEWARLARRLRFLGFGPLQDGLWVSPHDHVNDVTQLLGELEVAEHATVLVARTATPEGLPGLVGNTWDLSGLADRYGAFLAEFSPYLNRRERARLSDKEAFLVRTQLIHHFRGFPWLDPELVEELAPLGESRARAVATFQHVFTALTQPAEEHFWTVAAGFAAGGGPSSRGGGRRHA